MKQLSIKNTAFILLACTALIACGGSSTEEETTTGVKRSISSLNTRGTVAPINTGGAQVEVDGDWVVVDPDCGADSLDADGNHCTDVEYVNTYVVNGEVYTALASNTVFNSGDDGYAGILTSEAGDIVVFHTIDPLEDGFRTMEDAGVVSYSMAASYSYATVDSNGNIETYDGWHQTGFEEGYSDGHITFDGATGEWSATLGDVELSGGHVEDGFISGSSTLNGVEGTFDATEEVVLWDPYDDAEMVDVNGGFSGTDGDFGYAGSFGGDTGYND